ncbi:MAG TPA: hypothetical protein VFV38_24090 [Ktedonobacteraceae bacterium]|nr:hypothetical protein [Ktedonobacteraceae bacterium]
MKCTRSLVERLDPLPMAVLLMIGDKMPTQRAQARYPESEGMSAEFLAALTGEGRTVVTIQRTEQYTGLESFREVGEFAIA